ncbi:MAG: metal ABC transporter substrate-binding protein [Phycisphaerae bacterium]
MASIFPIQDAIRQIAGDDAQVDCLLPPGISPHGFELKAEQADLLAGSQLLVMVGLGVDEWADRAVKALPGLTVLKLGDDAQIKKSLLTSEEGEDEGHDAHGDPDGADHHSGMDPHIWLDPVIMQRCAALIADALIELDPSHRDGYLKRRDAFVAMLKGIDEDYRKALGPLKGREFVTYHAAFTYIAHRYGVVQVPLTDTQALEPGSGRIEKVLDLLKRHKASAIYVEPQFDKRRLEQWADEYKIAVKVLDPEGNPRIGGYDSYEAMMRSNLRNLVEGLASSATAAAKE